MTENIDSLFLKALEGSRQMGQTTALVHLAVKNNAILVVHSASYAYAMRLQYMYEDILTPVQVMRYLAANQHKETKKIILDHHLQYLLLSAAVEDADTIAGIKHALKGIL